MSGERNRAFAQVDVFSSTALLGNPVAVVLDAEGLSDEAMARFARWTNLSETTFVLPPTTPDADYLLRIFTPERELPFAGHPTLGSAHAWLTTGGTTRDGVIVQECSAGLVPLRKTEEGLAFAAPPLLRNGPLDGALLARIVAALRISPEQVISHRWVDNGPGWAAVRLRTAAEVLAIEPDLTAASDLMIGVIGARTDSEFEVRGFAPAVGVPEDPVTGSLNAGLAQWLIGTGSAPRSYVATQGTRVGRSGVVSLSADESGEVWVAGATSTVIHGFVRI